MRPRPQPHPLSPSSPAAPLRVDTLQQGKARLELSVQTLRQQHQKELEVREEEVEQLRASTSKKLKARDKRVEDLEEEKQALIKVGSHWSALIGVPGWALIGVATPAVLLWRDYFAVKNYHVKMLCSPVIGSPCL